ncbi:hypothetical protein EV426DRAFT_437244 [Tirmania nivea]|nr:hypothetical protein EV426DRAFT_437244 [Tirmania nivea]
MAQYSCTLTGLARTLLASLFVELLEKASAVAHFKVLANVWRSDLPKPRSHPQSNGIDRKQGQHSKGTTYRQLATSHLHSNSHRLFNLGVLEKLAAPRYVTAYNLRYLSLSLCRVFPGTASIAHLAPRSHPPPAECAIAKTTLHQGAASTASSFYSILGTPLQLLCGTIYNYEQTAVGGLGILPAVSVCVCACVCAYRY